MALTGASMIPRQSSNMNPIWAILVAAIAGASIVPDSVFEYSEAHATLSQVSNAPSDALPALYKLEDILSQEWTRFDVDVPHFDKCMPMVNLVRFPRNGAELYIGIMSALEELPSLSDHVHLLSCLLHPMIIPDRVDLGDRQAFLQKALETVLNHRFYLTQSAEEEAELLANMFEGLWVLKFKEPYCFALRRGLVSVVESRARNILDTVDMLYVFDCHEAVVSSPNSLAAFQFLESLDEFLMDNPIRSRRFVELAIEHGNWDLVKYFLVSGRMLEQHSISQLIVSISMEEYAVLAPYLCDYKRSIGIAACDKNRTDILEHFVNTFGVDSFMEVWLEKAWMNGHVEVIKFYEDLTGRAASLNVGDFNILNGSTAAGLRLIYHRFSTNFNLSEVLRHNFCNRGDLATLQFIFERDLEHITAGDDGNRTEHSHLVYGILDDVTHALSKAVIYGHLAVLEWAAEVLVSIDSPFFEQSQAVLVEALRNCSPAIPWYRKRYNEKIPHLDEAVEQLRTAMGQHLTATHVHYLQQLGYDIRLTENDFKVAWDKGDIETLHLIYSHPKSSKIEISKKMLLDAISVGHTDLLVWAHPYASDIKLGPAPVGVIITIANWRAHKVAHELYSLNPPFKPASIPYIASKGHIDAVLWILKHCGAECYPTSNNIRAFLKDNMTILLRYLHHLKPFEGLLQQPFINKNRRAMEVAQWFPFVAQN